jgi:hypothetical protein
VSWLRQSLGRTEQGQCCQLRPIIEQIKTYDAREAKSGKFLSFFMAAVGGGGFFDNSANSFCAPTLSLMVSMLFGFMRAGFNAGVFMATPKTETLLYGHFQHLKPSCGTA